MEVECTARDKRSRLRLSVRVKHQDSGRLAASPDAEVLVGACR